MRTTNWPLVLAIPAWIFTTSAHAADTNRTASIASDTLIIELDEYTRPPHDTIWAKFRNEIPKRTAYLDAFGPQTKLGWLTLENRVGYGIHDQVASKGKSVFETYALDSYREALADSLPFDDWESKWTHFWYSSWFGQLLENSIGNTLEERRSLASATPNESDIVEALQFVQPTSYNTLLYGFRSFTKYYVEADIGRLSATRPLMHAEVDLSLASLSAVRDGRIGQLAAQVLFPLPADSQLVLGGRMYTASDMRPAVSVRLQHLIFGGKNDTKSLRGIAFMGFSETERDRRFSIGMYFGG